MIAHRSFASYEEYVQVQGHKARTERRALIAAVPTSILHFQRIFRKAARYLHIGKPILCLGARTGAEVRAAIRVGFTGSVGIDLHPIGRDVLRADWHDLPFSAGSFPMVYTNSLDHCLYLDTLMSEIRRVLTPQGRLYVMASDRPGKTVDGWLKSTRSLEALYWQQSDVLCEAIMECGFARVAAWRSSVWGHYVLKVVR